MDESNESRTGRSLVAAPGQEQQRQLLLSLKTQIHSRNCLRTNERQSRTAEAFARPVEPALHHMPNRPKPNQTRSPRQKQQGHQPNCQRTYDNQIVAAPTQTKPRGSGKKITRERRTGHTRAWHCRAASKAVNAIRSELRFSFEKPVNSHQNIGALIPDGQNAHPTIGGRFPESESSLPGFPESGCLVTRVSTLIWRVQS